MFSTMELVSQESQAYAYICYKCNSVISQNLLPRQQVEAEESPVAASEVLYKLWEAHLHV